jgi:HK97 family phage portal protein
VAFWSRWFRASTPGPLDDFWYQPVGADAESGVRVTPDQAMRLGVVYACVKVISETLAGLPWIVYRRLDDGGKERAPDHRVQKILNRPNPYQTAFEFREQVIGFYAHRGNGFAELVPGKDWLLPRHNDRVVEIARASDGFKVYKLREVNGTERKVPQAFMWQPHLMSQDGLWGLSPIEMAIDSIGNAAAARRYSGRFFRNSARPSGIITRPREVQALNPEASRKYLAAVSAALNGENASAALLMQEGHTWTSTTITPDEAQFIETMQFGVEDVARFWRMPLHKIGHLLRSTNNNIEHQGIEFSTDTIQPHAGRLEQSLGRLLFTEEEQDEFFIEILLDGLLRGDLLSRYTAHNLALTGGWKTRNEVRVVENLNPLPGLDEPLQALNMGTPGGDPQQTAQPEDGGSNA